jgi:hypothetical protein
VKGTARLTTIYKARDHFRGGGTVLVAEDGNWQTIKVTPMTVVHDHTTITWDELVESVRMWKSRHPYQRYYIVTEDPE